MRGTTPHPLAAEDGFTLVELLVTMVLLLGGLFAILELVDEGARATADNQVRDRGANIAREVVERAQQAPYAQITPTGAAGAIAATLPETPAAGTGGFTVTRNGVDYAVTITTCTIDDPLDGYGPISGGCASNGNTGTGGATSPGGGVNAGVMLGNLPVNLNLTGDLIDDVCTLVGANNLLGPLVGATSAATLQQLGLGGASVAACPTGTQQVAVDLNPEDLKRVVVDVTWTSLKTRTGRSVRQTTLIPQPRTTT